MHISIYKLLEITSDTNHSIDVEYSGQTVPSSLQKKCCIKKNNRKLKKEQTYHDTQTVNENYKNNSHNKFL